MKIRQVLSLVLSLHALVRNPFCSGLKLCLKFPQNQVSDHDFICYFFSRKNMEIWRHWKLSSSSQNNCKESQIPSVINTFHRDSPLVSAHVRSSLAEVFLPSVKEKDGRALVLALWGQAGLDTEPGMSPALFPSLPKEGSRIPPLREQNRSGCEDVHFCLHSDLGDAVRK